MPALGLLVVATVALVAGYVTEAHPRSSPTPAAATAPQGEAVRGEILQVSGDRITVSTRGGTQTFRLTQATVFETLGTTTPLHVDVGDDWLNVGAVQHPQTLFVISGLVVISDNGPP